MSRHVDAVNRDTSPYWGKFDCETERRPYRNFPELVNRTTTIVSSKYLVFGTKDSLQGRVPIGSPFQTMV